MSQTVIRSAATHGPVRAREARREIVERPNKAFRQIARKSIALSQFGFPFELGSPSTNVARFRALARRSRFARRRALRLALNTVTALLWPVGALYRSLDSVAKMRRQMDSRFGARTFFDMYWLALRYSIPPLEYVVYGLDTPLRRAALHQYLYWNDLPAFAAINRQLGADNRDVQDKDRFARICARHGLPHVPTLAVFDHGSQRYPDAPFVPAAPLLWSKALRLKGGAGGTKWSRIGDVYRNSQSELLSASALAEAFLGQDCIVQPVLENHPAIAPITNGALATVRLVTGLDRSGEAVFVTSLLSLPRGANDTGIGGILCAIDRQTGRLTKAID